MAAEDRSWRASAPGPASRSQSATKSPHGSCQHPRLYGRTPSSARYVAMTTTTKTRRSFSRRCKQPGFIGERQSDTHEAARWPSSPPSRRRSTLRANFGAVALSPHDVSLLEDRRVAARSTHRARPGRKSWLVVARGVSERLRLVGHLGWVHRHEASPVGQPRERMGGRRERRTAGRDRARLVGKDVAPEGGSE